MKKNRHNSSTLSLPGLVPMSLTTHARVNESDLAILMNQQKIQSDIKAYQNPNLDVDDG